MGARLEEINSRESSVSSEVFKLEHISESSSFSFSKSVLGPNTCISNMFLDSDAGPKTTCRETLVCFHHPLLRLRSKRIDCSFRTELQHFGTLFPISAQSVKEGAHDWFFHKILAQMVSLTM
jgi:hypothetical protein